MGKKIVIVPIQSFGVCEACGRPFSYIYRHGKPLKYCLESECVRKRAREKTARQTANDPVHYREKRLALRLARNEELFKRPNLDPLFSSWFSGFFDGEGSFRLRMQPRSQGESVGICSAQMEIRLRDDDIPILQDIRAFFDAGYIRSFAQNNSDGMDRHPSATWSVFSIRELYHIFIPHFDIYPLRAKKRKDYEIWREGVIMMYLKNHLKDLEGFKALCAGLKEVRRYDERVNDHTSQIKVAPPA